MANHVNVDINANVQGYVDGINQAKQATADYTTETKKVQDNVGNFRKEFAAAKKDVMNLAQAYRNLSNEEKNSQFGKEMAKQLQAAKKKAAEMTDLMSDMQTELRNMASDTSTLDVLSEGVGVLGNAVSSASGAIALFTGDSEAAERAVVMFTTATSALNTVTKLQKALQMQSATMLGVTKIQTLAAAAADRIKTAAANQGTVATRAATVAQAAFNAVADANPYVLLATALVTLCAGLYAFCAATEDAEDEQEKLDEKMEEVIKKADEQRTTFLGAAASHHADAERLFELYSAYKTANSEIEKTAILEEATTHFKKLGIEVNGVNDAERILTSQIGTVTQLMKLQGDAAGVAALRMERFKDSMKKMMENGYSVGVASSLASAAVSEFDKELNKINAEIAAKKKELGIGSGSNKNNKDNKVEVKIEYDKDSLEDLQNQLSALENKLKNKNLLKVDVDKTIADINKLKNRIEEKEIELGIKEPDPKKIPFTEAWYNEQIAGLEKKKALLPIDAYVEREQLQNQIDGLKGKLKLELGGVESTGSKAISDIFGGKTKHNIKDINEAISTLQQRIKETDWNNIEPGAKTFDDYINKIQELKAELTGLEEIYDNAMLTPMDKAVDHFEKASKKAENIGSTLSSLGDVANAVGQAFKAAGDETTAAMMEIVTATLDMTAQIIPQIMKLIGAKQAEAMAQGTASAAKLPYPANLGAIASIVATILSTFATIYAAAQKFDSGGIVGGSSYHGDKILTRVESGEMILNKHQQKNLFDLLDGTKMPQSGGTNVTVTGVIRGTDIMLVQKNTNKVQRRTGTNLNI